MDFCNLASKYRDEIYRIVFLLGIGLLALALILALMELKIFSMKSALESFPVITMITASYLWIRLDIWRTDETIKELTGSSDSTVAQEDLMSRRADSQVAFGLLVLAAVAQTLSLKLKWGSMCFFGILFVFVPSCNWVARWMDRSQKSKFNINPKVSETGSVDAMCN